MGRKKIKKDQPKDKNTYQKNILKRETTSWITAIALFVLSVFFVLASFEKAGFVGEKAYYVFSILFGLGYFLLPIVCIILGISFTKKVRHSMTSSRLIGATLFFISSLALIDFIFARFQMFKKGGLIGNIIQKPLVGLFDIYATPIILFGIMVIGVLVIFDTPLNSSFISKMFGKKEGEDTEDEEDQREQEKEATITGIPIDKNNSAQKEKNVPITNSQVAKVGANNEAGELGIFKTNSFSKPFTPPPLSLLERDKGKPEVGDIKANANIIKRTLQNFGIIVEMDEISIGPSVTRYALKPAEGVKLSRILGLQNNLELALAAHPVRIEAPIPGKSLVGIEIPNSTKTTVGLASLLSQDDYSRSEKPLMVALGKNISGSSVFANLAKMPHLLIAGATGSGKSVTIHVIINSLLFRNSPDNLKFIMIDPKRVELTLYNKTPHLLTPVITDAKKAIMSLKWAAKEMERRYDILEKNRVRDIESYHKNILPEKVSNKKKDPNAEEIDMMPYIVVVIDELADIMQAYPRELESAIIRLAQMSRAVGIHLILSTQRPSVNVITGLIKANIPTRIALQVASQFDSRTILDCAGAEKLLGAGDMLYLSGEMSKPIRLQSPFISESEVKKVSEYLSKNSENEIPSEINMETENSKNVIFESMTDEDADDELYEEAREIVIRAGKASTSYLQRKLRVGYARAARLIDILEEKGVIGPGEGAKPREVLIKPESGFVTEEEKEDDEEFS